MLPGTYVHRHHPSLRLPKDRAYGAPSSAKTCNVDPSGATDSIVTQIFGWSPKKTERLLARHLFSLKRGYGGGGGGNEGGGGGGSGGGVAGEARTVGAVVEGAGGWTLPPSVRTPPSAPFWLQPLCMFGRRACTIPVSQRSVQNTQHM